jgi:hypothetical protein
MPALPAPILQPHCRMNLLDSLLTSDQYWEVQMKAAVALSKIRHKIPDTSIKRLYELRGGTFSSAVRDASEQALVSILSVDEIEDDA